MYTIGVVAFNEYVINDVTELEQALTRAHYPVHIEQMRGKPHSSQVVDFYYEENAILLWLCRCYGDDERCRDAIDCYIEAKVDLIVAMTPPALIQAIRFSNEQGIPIIFTHVSKLQYHEITTSYPQQTMSITGVYDIWMDIVGERISLLTEVVPPPKTVHTFYNSEISSSATEMETLQHVCSELGIELFPHITRSTEEVKNVLSSLKPRHDHAIFRMSDTMLHPLSGLIGAIAHEHYIPYMGMRSEELERCGSLFSLEPEGVGKQAATLVDLALCGIDLATIAPVVPNGKTLSINLQAAQNLGLIVSPAILAKAQTVIPARERRSLGARLRAIMIPATIAISIIAVAAFYLGVLPLFGLILLSTSSLAISLTIYLNRNIIRPINALSLAAEKIGAGEMNTPIMEVKVEDEVSALARALRRMKSNLSNSYVELEELTHSLEIRVKELTESNRALRQAQHELEIAGRRIIEAEDISRFALTTFIHDEILGPLDELAALSVELNDPDVQKLAYELESRMRQLRFDLSVPILKDLGVELRRLVQETLPLIYPNSNIITMDLDLKALDHTPEMEPSLVFLLYRFVRGAVSNVYRHSHADKIKINADYHDDKLSICIVDNGKGFDMNDMDQLIKNGHYFFHDIHIRARQLKGEFKLETGINTGTTLYVTVPIRRSTKAASREVIRAQKNKSPQLHPL